MKITINIIILSLVLNSLAFSQSAELLFDIPIYNQGKLIANPFTGGLKAGQFSKVDMNGDGVKDLFVFDRNGGVITTYINEGGEGEINYKYSPEYESIFPKARTFALLHDFNGDGIEDLFKDPTIGGIAGIEVWKGIRDANGLHYELVRNRDNFYNILFYLNNNNPVNVYNSIIDIPGIIDVDGDGDTDILTFEPDGTFLNYYRNQAVEKNLGLDTFDFSFTNNNADQKCFGKFQETMFSSEVLLSPNMNDCASGVIGHPSGNGAPRHAGSTVMAFDNDCDGDVDLLLGDFLTNHIVFLSNGGSPINSWITSQDATFPSYNVPVDMEVYLATFFIDINNDNKRDLIVTPNQEDVGRNQNHVWLYLNEGTDCAPIFKLHQRDFLIEDMLHFSRQSHPQFVDYNADGLLDILVGTGGEIITGTNIEKELYLLENVGTLKSPAFSVVTKDYNSISQLVDQISRIAPDIADIDNDGDDDLFLGSSAGEIFFYENTAGPNAPYTFKNPKSAYFDIFVGSNSFPELYDINKDGLIDFVIGENNNELNYLQNFGTKESPEFDSDVNAPINSKDLGNVFQSKNNVDTRNGNPVFFESFDQTYMLFGVADGSIKLYSNITAEKTDTFNLLNDQVGNIYVGKRVNCDIADINGDGKYDLVVGNERGGLHLYSTDIVYDRSVNVKEEDFGTIEVYPNPIRNYVYINGEFENGLLTIYNAIGQMVLTQPIEGNSVSINTESFDKGVYFLKIYSENKIFKKKIVKQ